MKNSHRRGACNKCSACKNRIFFVLAVAFVIKENLRKRRFWATEGDRNWPFRIPVRWSLPDFQTNRLYQWKDSSQYKCGSEKTNDIEKQLTSGCLPFFIGSREFKIWRRQRQRQRHKSMIWLAVWKKIIVLHVQHAYWWNVLTLSAKRLREIFIF